jgi:hypothetical protein
MSEHCCRLSSLAGSRLLCFYTESPGYRTPAVDDTLYIEISTAMGNHCCWQEPPDQSQANVKSDIHAMEEEPWLIGEDLMPIPSQGCSDFGLAGSSGQLVLPANYHFTIPCWLSVGKSGQVESFPPVPQASWWHDPLMVSDLVRHDGLRQQ